MSRSEFALIPIGTISCAGSQPQLKIDPTYRSALQGLSAFSHLIVLYWCHHTATEAHRSALVHEKPYLHGPERIGVLATRSPARPNPIALTVVQLAGLDLAAGVIDVPYIDAADGTPIIDLKPYHPSLDRIREVRLPGWCGHWPQWSEDSATFDWEGEFCFG